MDLLFLLVLEKLFRILKEFIQVENIILCGYNYRVSIKGTLLNPIQDSCPYLEGRSAQNEAIIIRDLGEEALESLLSRGFRHFGDFFFRPICRECSSCIPIRIPAKRFPFSRSARRVMKKNEAFRLTLGSPVASPGTFDLYMAHKRRFNTPFSETYDIYKKSFFYPFSFNRMFILSVGDTLVAVSHLDVTGHVISAVYTYFNEDFKDYSPGRFMVYKMIEMAQQKDLDYVYLGYYIRDNRHMNYKINFKPNQLLSEDHHWIDFMDNHNGPLQPLPQPYFHLLADY